MIAPLSCHFIGWFGSRAFTYWSVRIPGSTSVRHVRPKYACDKCNHVVEAPAPSRTIARGLAGPGLVAHVLIAKYADHCPLYRQSDIYAREGVELDRSTMADWVGAASQLLTPFVDALRKHVLAADKIHADDTPVPVLAPGRGKTKPDACGPMSATNAWPGSRLRRPYGSPTRRIARASIHACI
jgi:hypothetical protein